MNPQINLRPDAAKGQRNFNRSLSSHLLASQMPLQMLAKRRGSRNATGLYNPQANNTAATLLDRLTKRIEDVWNCAGACSRTVDRFE